MVKVWGVALFLAVTACAFRLLGAFTVQSPADGAPTTKADPWTLAQLVNADDFSRELTASKDASRPTILYVGFRTLFLGGHIPGAEFHGTASTDAGIATVRSWAASLPKDTNIVIYCGCCPFEKCPNIRPAFVMLRDLGFTRVRVLRLPTSFAVDWAEKNHPVEKGLRTE
jgi:thiosulfate/3-mercaptopyruvate sulfurtransferase